MTGLATAASTWFASKSAPGGWSPVTRHYAELAIKKWVVVLKDTPLDELRPLDIEQLRLFLVSSLSPSWVNITRKFFRSFWKWAQSMELVSAGHDPTTHWRRAREEPRRKYLALEPDEATRFIEALREDIRSWARFAYLTGLRTGTCRALQWEDVTDLPDGGARLEIPGAKMKMRKPFVTVIGPASRTAMGARRCPQDAVFSIPSTTILYRLFKRAARQAGVDRAMSPHQLRRSYAAQAFKAGATLREVADAGAWSSEGVLIRFYMVDTAMSRRAELAAQVEAQFRSGTKKAPDSRPGLP